MNLSLPWDILLALLEQDGLAPKRKTANEYGSPCPACGGRDRLVIHADTGRYWCRQCGAKGDAMQYLIDFHGMTSRDAAAAVGKNLSPRNGNRPKERPAAETAASQPQPQNKPKDPEVWRQRVAQGIANAHSNLLRNSGAMNWLRAERGLTAETVARFKLGWLSENRYFKREEFSLPDNGKKLVVPAGLLIPWQDKRIRVRRSNEEEAKQYGRYYYVPGSSTEPFEVGTPYETTAIILESELDAILLAQEIRRKVFIVAMGSTSNKPDESLLEKLSQCPVILVCMDTDGPGGKAAKWWLKNVDSTFRTLTPARYGKDITEAFLSGLSLNEWFAVSMEIYAEEVLLTAPNEVTPL